MPRSHSKRARRRSHALKCRILSSTWRSPPVFWDRASTYRKRQRPDEAYPHLRHTPNIFRRDETDKRTSVGSEVPIPTRIASMDLKFRPSRKVRAVSMFEHRELNFTSEPALYKIIWQMSEEMSCDSTESRNELNADSEFYFNWPRYRKPFLSPMSSQLLHNALEIIRLPYAKPARKCPSTGSRRLSSTPWTKSPDLGSANPRTVLCVLSRVLSFGQRQEAVTSRKQVATRKAIVHLL